MNRKKYFVIISLLLLCLGYQKTAQCQVSFLWPNASTYNPVTDKYYITNYKGKNVISLDPSGNKAIVADSLVAPNNLLYASLPIGKGYIVLDSNMVKGYDSAWSYYASFSVAGALKLQDAVFDETNAILYISDVDRGVIYKTTFGSAPFYIPSTSILSSPFNRPSAMVLQLAKNRILYVEDTIGGRLMSADLSSGQTAVVRNLNMDNLVGLAEDGQGNLYLSSQGLKAVYKFNRYYAGSPVKLYSEPKPGDILVNAAKDQWVYECLICGSVFTPPLHLFGPGIEMVGCPGDSFHCYKNYLHNNIGTFEYGNHFIMELSDSNGKFGKPIKLAEVADTLIPAEMDCTIPKLSPGKGYKVRWRSTKPAVTGSSEAAQIYSVPQANVSLTDTVQGCKGSTVTLGTNNSRDTQFHYVWWPASMVDSASNAVVHTTADTGKWIGVQVHNTQGCYAQDSAYVLPVNNPKPNPMPDTVQACYGSKTQLGSKAISGLSYHWKEPGNVLSDSFAADPYLYPTNGGLFTVTVSAAGGCSSTDSQWLIVHALPTFALHLDTVTLCPLETVLNFLTPDGNPHQTWWTSARGFVTPGDTSTCYYADSGINGVIYISTTTGCHTEKTFIIKGKPYIDIHLQLITADKAVLVGNLTGKHWYRIDTLLSYSGDTFTATVTGYYKACGTVSTGCYECTKYMLLTPQNLQTRTLVPNALSCSIYPVPVNDILHLECNGGKDVAWDILRPDGTQQLHGNGKLVYTNDLEPGIYLLKINGTFAGKIVKN